MNFDDVANLIDRVFISCGSPTRFVKVISVWGRMVPPIMHPLLRKNSTNRSPLLLMAPQPYLPIASSLPVLTSVKLPKLTVFKANEVSNPRIENLLACVYKLSILSLKLYQVMEFDVLYMLIRFPSWDLKLRLL